MNKFNKDNINAKMIVQCANELYYEIVETFDKYCDMMYVGHVEGKYKRDPFYTYPGIGYEHIERIVQ